MSLVQHLGEDPQTREGHMTTPSEPNHNAPDPATASGPPSPGASSPVAETAPGILAGVQLLTRPEPRRHASRWNWRRTAVRLGAVTTLALLAVGVVTVHRLDRERTQLRASGEELRGALADAKARADGLGTDLGKTAAESREHAELRDAHLATAQLMRVAGLYRSDPLGAVALLHDYDVFPIDRRDDVWHFYANCCERRFRPDVLGKVIATSIHGRRVNIYPVPHRDKNGRVLALVETPDGKWKVTNLASGEVVRATHPDLQQRGEMHVLSIDGSTVGVWTKGKEVKNEKTGKVETPSEYGFVDVETGQWHKLRLTSSRGLLTPDGKRFVIHNEAERAMYDVATGDDVSKVAYGEKLERVEGTTAVSADGKYFASFVKSEKTPGVVRIIDAQTNKELAQVAPPKREIELFGKQHPITDPEVKLGVELLQFSPDGKKLVIAYRYRGKIDIPQNYVECHVVSVPDGVRIGVHDVVNSEFPTYVAFNQDGSQLAVSCGVGSGFGGPRGTIGVYRTNPGKNGDYLLPVVHKFAWPIPVPHPLARVAKGADWGSVRGLSFAPDNSRVAIAVQTQGGYHVVEADVHSGRLRLLPGSLPSGGEKTDANAHISSRNELLVVTEFGTLHRWRLNPDDATATLPHTSPHQKLRHTETAIAFDKHSPALFVRYWYDHWHDGKEAIAKRPADLKLQWNQPNLQSYSLIKSLEPPVWKPQGLTDQTPAVAAFPENEAAPPPVSPDGRTSATVAVNGDIELWDVRTKRLRAVLESHGHPIKALRFSPDGRALASLDAAHVVKVWDFSAPALYGQWRGTAAAFSPDEKTVAVGGHVVDHGPLDNFTTVMFVELKTGRGGGHIKFWGDPTTMAYSTDGEVLAVGDTLLIRDATDWKDVAFDGPKWVSGEVRVFLPEAKVLADFNAYPSLGSSDSRPEQAQIKRGGTDKQPVTVLRGVVETSSFNIYGIAIGYRGSDKTVMVVLQSRRAELAVSHYDSTTGKRKELRTVPLKTSVDSLWTVLPGGESIVATDRTTGEFVKRTVSLQVIDLKTGAGQPLPGNHTGGCMRVAVSPDGRLLASADGLGEIRIWDLRERRLVNTFWARGNGVASMTFSPKGRYLAVAGSDKMVRVWELAVLGHEG